MMGVFRLAVGPGLIFVFILVGVRCCCCDAEVGTPSKVAHSPRHVLLSAVALFGHTQSVLAVGETLARRGHTVSFATERVDWCEASNRNTKAQAEANRLAPTPLRCVGLPKLNLFNDTVIDIMSNNTIVHAWPTVVAEMQRAQREMLPHLLAMFEREWGGENPATPPPTTIVANSVTWAAHDLGRLYDLPVTTVNPMLLYPTFGNVNYAPMVAFALPQVLDTVLLRTFNLFLRVMHSLNTQLAALRHGNRMRSKYSIPRYDSYLAMFGYSGGPVITPAVWHFDVAQPLCPNWFPVANLVPAPPAAVVATRVEASNEDALEPALRELLESPACHKHGAVYVNFGSMSSIADPLQATLNSVLLLEEDDGEERGNGLLGGMCVVWKPHHRRYADVVARLKARPRAVQRRVYVTRFFLSATGVLRHPVVRTFLTHCGQASANEARLARLPVVGVPLVSEQPDTCRRVEEAGIGVYAGDKLTVTPKQLAAALRRVAHNETFRTGALAAFDKIARLTDFMGGNERAADVVEAHAAHRLGDDVLSCATVRPSRMRASLLSSVFGEEIGGILIANEFDVLLLRAAMVAVVLRAFVFGVRRVVTVIVAAQRFV